MIRMSLIIQLIQAAASLVIIGCFLMLYKYIREALLKLGGREWVNHCSLVKRVNDLEARIKLTEERK